ncbi:hypothetical protein D3C73_1593550 [compost metagenome]
MIGIATHAESDQFGVNGRTTSLGMFQFLQHEGTGAIRQHEAVTPLVPGTTGPRRIIIAGGQRSSCAESA